MNMNILKAFSFLKNDDQWVKKLLIGGLLMILPTVFNMLSHELRPNNNISLALVIGLIVTGLISIFTTLAACGYYGEIMKDKIEDGKEGLPLWEKYGHLMLVGLKFYVGFFLCTLPFAIIIMLLLFISGLSTLIAPFAAPVFLVIALAITLLMSIVAILMTSNFGKDLKIISFVNFKEGAELVKGNFKNFVLLIVFSFCLFLIYGFLSFILTLSKIGIALLPFVTIYIMFVSADLQAQFTISKKAQGAIETSEA